MSLEAAIQANTAALEGLIAALSSNTNVLEKVDAGREAAMSVIQANTGAKATTSKASTKADKPAETAAEKPKADDYAGDEGFARLKTGVITPYLNTDDKDEQKARMGVFAKALVKLGAVGDDGKPGLGKLPADKRVTLAGWVAALAKGENVPELAEDEPAGGGLLD